MTWAIVNKNSCLCIYNYRTLLFCEARGKVNKLYLTNPSPNPSVNTHWRISANSSRHYHDFHKTWSTETPLGQLSFVEYNIRNFLVNLPKAVFCSLQSVYELKLPFHYLGLQVDGFSRGRADARKKQVYRCMCTATSRLLQAVRSCTHTSVLSLVKGVQIFEMLQKIIF